MSRNNPTSIELPTFAVLVGPAGDILDVQTHHSVAAVFALKGAVYTDHCGPKFRPAIKALINRQRDLLSAVMPPGTLALDSWFAVVGVPLGPSKESGALLVHMDITPWVSREKGETAAPKSISMDLLQKAMSSTFVDNEKVAARVQGTRSQYYDGIESLTDRQRQVLKLIGVGKSNIEISEELSCSLNTVKRHVTAVLQKLRVPNRTRAAMLANRIGDLAPGPR